jgi:hypothetical protein
VRPQAQQVRQQERAGHTRHGVARASRAQAGRCQAAQAAHLERLAVVEKLGGGGVRGEI